MYKYYQFGNKFQTFLTQLIVLKWYKTVLMHIWHNSLGSNNVPKRLQKS
mgnify:CR=1